MTSPHVTGASDFSCHYTVRFHYPHMLRVQRPLSRRVFLPTDAADRRPLSLIGQLDGRFPSGLRQKEGRAGVYGELKLPRRTSPLG